jgi:TonB family protein
MKRLLFLLAFLPGAVFGQTYSLPPNATTPVEKGPVRVCPYPWSSARDLPKVNTELAYKIGVDGIAASVTVAKPSGNLLLDRWAVLCVIGRRYDPATLDGKPVDTKAQISFTWISIPQNPGDIPPKLADLARGKRGGLPRHKGSNNCASWHHSQGLLNDNSVLVTFDIDTEGAVGNAAVARSSGQDKLDKDAVECVSSWRYWPLIADGNTIPFQLSATLY